MQKKLEDVKVINCFGDDYKLLTVPKSSDGNIKTPFCYYAVVEGPVGSDDPTQFVCIWEIKECVVDALRDIFVIKMQEFYGGAECLSKSDDDILEIAQNLTENEYYFCDWGEPFDVYPINDKVAKSPSLCGDCIHDGKCPGWGSNDPRCEDFIRCIK